MRVQQAEQQREGRQVARQMILREDWVPTKNGHLDKERALESGPAKWRSADGHRSRFLKQLLQASRIQLRTRLVQLMVLRVIYTQKLADQSLETIKLER